MNTFIHLIAMVLVFWFSWWMFDRGQTVPGVGILAVGLIFTAWTIQALVEDLGDLRANKRRGRR